MKTDILQRKLERYVKGEALPAETRQIQTWLSCTSDEISLSAEEKQQLEDEILKDIQDHTAYPLFFPKKEKAWWQKAVAALF
jgi:hypothetical protein